MMFTIVFAIGILILLLGVLLGSVRGVIHRPDQFDEDKFDTYETATRWLNFFSGLMINLGLILAACASFITAIFNPNMHPSLRAGLAIAGGLILGFTFA